MIYRTDFVILIMKGFSNNLKFRETPMKEEKQNTPFCLEELSIFAESQLWILEL